MSADRPDPNRWRALAVCLTAGFLTLLDISIVNVALPSIEQGLDADDSQLQLILTGYALAFGLVLVSAGRIGDARGRRRVFLVGLGVFVLASALAGLAPNAEFLTAARVVQGFGAGILNPQISGFIQALFRGPERGRAFGALGACIGVSTAVGPLSGGLILDLVGGDDAWRWIFLVNIPVGLAAMALAFRLLPTADPGRHDERLDPVGVTLLGSGVVLLLLPLVGENTGDLTERTWWPALVGVVVLVGFLLWERRLTARGGAPVVDLSLFRRRSFALGASLGAVYFAGFTSVFFVLTVTLQSGLDYSPLAAGVAATPFALGGALFAFGGGRLVQRYGRGVVAVGLVLTIVGVVGCAVVAGLVEPAHLGWALAAPQFVAGAGSGLTISPNVTLTVSEVPVEGAGSAGGVLQTGQRIGTALGLAGISAVYFTVLADGGDYVAALRAAFLATGAVVGLALLLAVLDLALGRRAAHHDPSTAAPATT